MQYQLIITVTTIFCNYIFCFLSLAQPQGSPTRSIHKQNVKNHHHRGASSPNAQANKIHTSSKKWWRLLDWLPGIKSIRNSRMLARSPTPLDGSSDAGDNRYNLPVKSQDEYCMQMHTFKSKEESCRPVG